MTVVNIYEVSLLLYSLPTLYYNPTIISVIYICLIIQALFLAYYLQCVNKGKGLLISNIMIWTYPKGSKYPRAKKNNF